MAIDYKFMMGIVVVAPLLGSIISGFFGKVIGRSGAHCVTILGVAVSLCCSLILANWIFISHLPTMNFNLYEWTAGESSPFHVGFLIDPLSVAMMVVVTFVSLLVHLYTIGYMHEDPGYQRFFSYISLFTFSMLMLVSANNFVQLFFGWEAVGLVSYLLIGFWFTRESALQGSLKAFLVNRVGDFGFLLGIAMIFAVFGTLDYQEVFSQVNKVVEGGIVLFPALGSFSLLSVICILLFIGAMGKSAQVPLHVWLPESMEGPTPISALIHAATMVTAGIFMVSRLSPLFELSETALSFILVIGATTALFMGLVGLVQNDIKRVIAYSTLSQLGYMIAALGASAYSAGMFHLITHACFKALLFLAAGSVIMGMHHEQNMQNMGGLWRRMPITYFTFLIGSLALCGIPPFAGFFSKDAILEAIQASQLPGARYAFWCVTAGVFVTALYTFRCLILTFHSQPRMDHETYHHVQESPWVVWVPLVVLAIPSVLLGYYLIDPMLFSLQGLLQNSIFVLPTHNNLPEWSEGAMSATKMMHEAPLQLPLYLAMGGIAVAYICYQWLPELPRLLIRGFGPSYQILKHKYGFDALYDRLFVRGSRKLGQFLWRRGDTQIIDQGMVNGSARLVGFCSRNLRLLQSGLLPHYLFSMIAGLMLLIGWQFWR